MPKHSETDTLSAGCNRPPGGQNVAGGVVVAVMDGAAVGARPFAVTQREHMSCRPARTARLRGRVEAVHLDQRSPVPRGLVGQLADQFSPSGVGDELAVPLGFQHPSHRQGLAAHRLVLTDQSSAQLVQEVLPRTAHGGMGTGHLEACLRPISGTLLFARQPTLLAGKPLPTFGEVARVGDLLARGQDGQVLQSKVDANLAAAFQRLSPGGNVARHVPAPVRLARYRDGGRFRRKLAGPHHVQRLGHLRQLQRTVAIVKAGLGELGGLRPILAAELRIARRPAEEVSVRRVEMAQRLLKRDAGHLVQPDELRLLLQRRQHGVGLLKAASLLALRPCRFPQRASAVVDHAHAPERPVQQIGLLRCRVEAKPIGGFDGRHHPSYVRGLAAMFNLCSSGASPHFLPAVNNRVSMRRIG